MQWYSYHTLQFDEMLAMFYFHFHFANNLSNTCIVIYVTPWYNISFGDNQYVFLLFSMSELRRSNTYDSFGARAHA
jgi:hypothetical protein